MIGDNTIFKMHIPDEDWERLEKLVEYINRSQADEHLWTDECTKKQIKKYYKAELKHGVKYTVEAEKAREKQYKNAEEERYKRDVELRQRNRELYRQWLVANCSPDEVSERMKL